ncbi:MAG: hypothetical protein R3318_04035, partial [Gammaproteobacteria bacterium]|nr:hypothetical protein [Gammaproteobacteria bacterium]
MNINQPAERLLGFVHHLRDEGFSIGIRETMDMLSCLDNDDVHGRTWTRNVIRSLACHSHSDWQKFDDLFLDYWLVDEVISEIRHDDDTPAGSSKVELTGIGGSSRETPEQMGGVTGLK